MWRHERDWRDDRQCAINGVRFAAAVANDDEHDKRDDQEADDRARDNDGNGERVEAAVLRLHS